MIEALHDDGSPVDKGDSVFCVWDNGTRCAGMILKVNGPRIFITLRNSKIQTYSVKSADGFIRPANANNIKTVFKRWR